MRFALTAALLLTSTALAQSAGTLLVANQTDRTLSFIDPATNKQTFALAEDRITGHEVTASPDGRTAFLPIYGGAGVGRAGTDGHEMLVIDVPSHTIRATVDFGHPVRPHLPVYDTRRNVLYVSTELDNTITAIDPRTLKILYTIPTGAAQSHMFALSHDGHLAYSTNVGPGSISVMDLDKHTLVATIPMEASVQRISLSNDDKLLFTSDWKQPRLAVVDTATRKLKQWIALPGTGYGSAATADGRFLLLALPTVAKVAILDLASLTIVRTLDVPPAPQEVLIRPDGRSAYVSCNSSHQVANLDLSSPNPAAWHVQALIEAGSGADGLAWAPAR